VCPWLASPASYVAAALALELSPAETALSALLALA
jgi:hypothetical protein